MTNEETQEQVVDAKDLKIQHYREKCSQLEEALADARVDFTIMASRWQQAMARIEELEATDDVQEAEED